MWGEDEAAPWRKSSLSLLCWAAPSPSNGVRVPTSSGLRQNPGQPTLNWRQRACLAPSNPTSYRSVADRLIDRCSVVCLHTYTRTPSSHRLRIAFAYLCTHRTIPPRPIHCTLSSPPGFSEPAKPPFAGFVFSVHGRQ